MEKMKIGVLGTGDIATRISNTIKGMNGVEMYAVASRNYDHAKRFGEEFGYRRIYRTYDEVLDDPQVDLVYLGLHHTQHYEYAKKCLARRKPLLCEKPFTINRYQAQEIVKGFREAGVFLCEALWTRFLPVKGQIEEAINSGMIGKLKMIDVNMICPISENPRMTDPQKGGGALLDLGVYALNFSTMFFGKDIQDIKSLSTFWKTDVDEQEAVILRYPEKKLAVCKISMVGCGNAGACIYGTEGHIEVDDVMNLNRAIVYNRKNEVITCFSKETGKTGYEYEFMACKKALEEGKLECEEMPLDETVFLMEQYDRLRSTWEFDYPCERGLL